MYFSIDRLETLYVEVTNTVKPDLDAHDKSQVLTIVGGLISIKKLRPNINPEFAEGELINKLVKYGFISCDPRTT